MKPLLLKVATGTSASFSVRRDLVPFFNNKWHYHLELELVSFEKGSGMQFVGDHMKNFGPGDVVFIGSNLPHYWRFDANVIEGETEYVADTMVSHFSEQFLGRTFVDLPENKHIKQLFERAKRGIQVNGKTRKQVASLMQDMLKAESFKRLMILLQILDIIARSTEVEYLSSISFLPNPEQSANDRVNAIYEYSINNYMNKISLEEVAKVANISPNSFCRYFKANTGKTYSGFLLEYKVGVACKLLIEDKLSIQQICYESGFNNFAGFYKYFKKITGKTPHNYQKEFIAQN
ncbi:AraC family transcriptional regulator [Mucilaginibacter myungsuensis]|uniref:AraC family transcriptional regulator n=1 Tax=Mucilaginibacter myungsuensis TaxID=649104 RepID=A0A929L086_9SPHI|nr:AraC family transcriptional regulator [Mucilaginibacter myungsuensis]MBE9662114.1 AraC family transcriptional regulator [Mucilaginibacter myungsuensis]MDN3599452.1 AraC family transcriptional regulator [Mucilaginibacter myungsuensis]